MPRNIALKRTLTLWSTLRDGRQWTLNELSEKFGVTTRTVRRDIEALEDVGAAICHDPGTSQIPGTWWVLER